MNLPQEKRQAQINIIDCMARHLTEERATDGLAYQVLEKIVKNFARQGPEFHDVFVKMIFAHIQKSNFAINVSSIVEMIKCPYKGLQQLGVRI